MHPGRYGTCLGANLDVGCDNRRFDDRDHEHDTDNAQEAENVVVSALILPQASKDEKQLDEDDGKRDQPRKSDEDDTISVPCLLGDLTGSDVRLSGMLPWLTAMVAIPTACVH